MQTFGAILRCASCGQDNIHRISSGYMLTAWGACFRKHCRGVCYHRNSPMWSEVKRERAERAAKDRGK